MPLHNCMKFCEICGIKICYTYKGWANCAPNRMWRTDLNLCEECWKAKILLEKISN